MKPKSKNIKLIVFFVLLYTIISIYNLNGYFSYKNLLKPNNVISYELIELKKQGGRGSYYRINVLFKNEEYWVDITKTSFLKAKKNVLPTLYYSDELNEVISEWTVEQSFRYFIIFFICFIISAIILVFSIKPNSADM